MAIRVQYQGAGAGAGIDLVAQQKRKYDLQMKQQDEQRDLMTKVGLQNRDAMMRQYQDANQNAIRQGMINAANQRQDANWARDQKAAADQQRQAAANARAMKTGAIKSSIESGEYDPKDAAKIQEYLDQQDKILIDQGSNDDQKANALATLDGQMETYLGRKKAPAAKFVPYDQADPKLRGQISDSIRAELEKRGGEYTDQELYDAEVEYYNRRYGGGQSQQGGGAQGQPQQPQPYGPPEGPTAPTQAGAQQAAAQQDDGLRPAPNATVIQQDGIFYVPMDNGAFQGFRTQEQAQQFAGLGQTAQPGTAPPQASAASQPPTPAPQPEQGQPAPQQVGAQPAPQQAGAQPAPMNMDGWSPWDVKNHGKDSRGYFKGLTPRAGATIEDHTFQGGYKGFKVLREGGGASTFASRAAAEAFLASGKQAAPQQPQQSSQPQQQAVPVSGEQQAPQEVPQSSPASPLPSAETQLPQGQERYVAPSGTPMIRTVPVPESQADLTISPFEFATPPLPEKPQRKFGKPPVSEPKTAKEAAKLDEKGYSRFKSDAKDILTTEYNDKRAAWEATEGTPNRPPAPVRPTIDQILQKSEELWDAEQRWFKSGGSAETPPSTAPPQRQQPKSTQGFTPTATASGSQSSGQSPTSPQPQPPPQGGSVTGDLKPPAPASTTPPQATAPTPPPQTTPSTPPTAAAPAQPQLPQSQPIDPAMRQQAKSTRGFVPTGLGDISLVPGAKPIPDVNGRGVHVKTTNGGYQWFATEEEALQAVKSGQPIQSTAQTPSQTNLGGSQRPKPTQGSMPTAPTSATLAPEGLAKSSTISNFTGKERLGGLRPAPNAKVQVSPDGKQFFVTDSKGKPVQFGSKEKAQEFIDTEKLETLAGEQNDLMSGKRKSFDGDWEEGSDGQLKWIEGAAYDPAAFNWDTAIKATEPALRKAKENIREFASTQPKPVQDAIQIMLDETANMRDKVRATDILRIAKVDLKAIMQGKNGTSEAKKKKL